MSNPDVQLDAIYHGNVVGPFKLLANGEWGIGYRMRSVAQIEHSQALRRLVEHMRARSKHVHVYHGTSMDNAKSIARTGFRGNGIYATTNRILAAQYAQEHGAQGAVVKCVFFKRGKGTSYTERDNGVFSVQTPLLLVPTKIYKPQVADVRNEEVPQPPMLARMRKR